LVGGGDGSYSPFRFKTCLSGRDDIADIASSFFVIPAHAGIQ